MNPKCWLSVIFLMSRFGIFEAAGQCGNSATYSVRGMFLRGHTFKTLKIGWHEGCYFKCAEEVTCQSYNVVIGQNVCELNNRTKEARPEDFLPDWTRYYMKRAKNRGTLALILLVCFSFSTRRRAISKATRYTISCSSLLCQFNHFSSANFLIFTKFTKICPLLLE